MALEIERKFLLRPGMTLPSSDHVENIRQCYIVSDDALVVRVRIIDEERAILGIKIAHEETLSVRTEYEYEIPIEEALEMMSSGRFWSRYQAFMSQNLVRQKSSTACPGYRGPYFKTWRTL